LPFADLTHLPPALRRAEAERLAAREAARPFDLGRGPVLRATLLGLSDAGDEHAILFTLHHIAADGWSVGVLVREVGALYGAVAARPPPPPAPPARLGASALGRPGWPPGRVPGAGAAPGRRGLAGLEPLELPADRPRPAAASYAGATRAFRLPEDLAGAIGAI